MSARHPLACVLMASGFSRRFGSDKLLAGHRGRPLYAWAMDAIPPEAFAQAVVVARCPEVARAARARGFFALSRPEATEHIAGTIREGLRAVTDTKAPIAGCCFVACDQPLLARQSVEELAAAFQREPQCIWALSHGGERGSPVIFPASLFEELRALAPTERGSTVIQRHEGLLRLLEARHPWELLDVDILEDLAALPGP